jgi:peptidyl-prolyl cis-trans isomerase SurA
MRRLREAVMSGASFPQLARQFSQAASAADGGDLGWIAQSQLGGELAPVVTSMEVGALSEPIRVIGGYSMILLRERRQGMEIDPMDAGIVMRQAVLPLDSDPAMVREIGAMLTACDDFGALQQQRPDLLVSAAITIRLGELQPSFLEVLEDLAPGDLAQPIESNQGIHLVMICERTEPESPLATREEVRANLENAQFDLIARGYLRDLRRQAFVDVRI